MPLNRKPTSEPNLDRRQERHAMHWLRQVRVGGSWCACPFRSYVYFSFFVPSYEIDLPMSEQTSPIPRWEALGNSVPGPHFSDKTAIAGHNSQKNGEILDGGHVKVIDTYCHGGGWLTAPDVHTEEVWPADREGNIRRF